MINFLEAYMKMMSQRRNVIHFRYNSEYVEFYGYSSFVDRSVKMVGIGKGNQTLLEGNFDFIRLDDQVETMKKCKMIIFKSEDVSTTALICYLNSFSYNNNCFAPIVCTSEEVLFFPQLRYQDSYLLKSILDIKFVPGEYFILFANKNDMMAIV